MRLNHPLLAVLTAALAGCGASDPGTIDKPQSVYKGIDAGEHIELTGTEPFWRGSIQGDEFTYKTPENSSGATVKVTRFAGNNGLGFSGRLQGVDLDLAITPGACSDQMSGRTYPYTATLRIGDEQRFGCAWTDSQPFEGPEQP